jgi:hypothetical protein
MLSLREREREREREWDKDCESRSALTRIHPATVGTEWPRPRMHNICSSPKYAAAGWKIQYALSVRLKGTMTNGRFNLTSYPGQDSNPRSELTFVRRSRRNFEDWIHSTADKYPNSTILTYKNLGNRNILFSSGFVAKKLAEKTESRLKFLVSLWPNTTVCVCVCVWLVVTFYFDLRSFRLSLQIFSLLALLVQRYKYWRLRSLSNFTRLVSDASCWHVLLAADMLY